MILVPEDFIVPTSLKEEKFRLEPLTGSHNEEDYAAWQSSIEHIHATPGFSGKEWPMKELPLETNLEELNEHHDDFKSRKGFTYTVLSTSTGKVIGCVYLYEAKREGYDVDLKSWVSADYAELDKSLHEAVLSWLKTEWPFKSVDYATR
ncbi:hypothetical protein BJ878DRAFT_542866 [Calycina marina]|uniref:N-acetyltransferase n=1 Tax=Calycina marina TaxID=1763456 RepID=A0A9P7Z1H9_9HELO|nr:hypothetical protein BJ878DRAFT_542866 [Calycina marina]